MDVFATGETASGMALDAQIGGSPLNVAIGLARLSQPVSFFGALSRFFPLFLHFFPRRPSAPPPPLMVWDILGSLLPFVVLIHIL